MSDSRKPGRSVQDDLLANAIPIDHAQEAEQQPDEPSSSNRLDPLEIDLGPDEPAEPDKPTIRTFDQPGRAHTDKWDRKPNVTGQGAIHVKTFFCKFRSEALEHLDEQINEWLDAHPEYEVKLVTTSVGQLIGKNTEDALVVNVWV